MLGTSYITATLEGPAAAMLQDCISYWQAGLATAREFTLTLLPAAVAELGISAVCTLVNLLLWLSRSAAGACWLAACCTLAGCAVELAGTSLHTHHVRQRLPPSLWSRAHDRRWHATCDSPLSEELGEQYV